MFLHGTNTIVVKKGARPIAQVPTSVIGLIGISNVGPDQTLTLVNSAEDAEQFGDAVQGNTIALALKAIQAHGAGQVLVVNVYDPASHHTTVTDEIAVVTNSRVKTVRPIRSVIAVTDNPETITYVNGVDYILDDYELRIPAGSAITEGQSLLVDYDYVDETKVTAIDIAGSASPKEGLFLFDDAFTQFGFNPKIMIAPFFANNKAVVSLLLLKCEKFKAITIVDSNPGDDVDTAIANRGVVAEAFSLTSPRLFLSYPQLTQISDINREITVPYSSFIAGVIAKTDRDFGFWYSPSNKTIDGVQSYETLVTSSINDATTEANQLNAAGITTYFSTFGSGLRVWGNHNASFPTSSDPDNFLSVQRTADILSDSVELAMLQFLDLPVTTGLIDAIRESVNAFIRQLIGEGALLDGSECLFIEANNPPSQIAQGILVFDITMMPPVPAQTITFKRFIDINLLNNLFAA